MKLPGGQKRSGAPVPAPLFFGGVGYPWGVPPLFENIGGAAPPTKNYVGAKIEKKLSKYIVIKGQKNFAATTFTKLSGVRFRGGSGKFSKYQFFRSAFDAAKTTQYTVF